MKAQVLLCECCGAALDVPAGALRVRCEFCGSSTVPHSPMDLHWLAVEIVEHEPATVSAAAAAEEGALDDGGDGPALEISGPWGLAAVLIVAVCVATISGAFAAAAVLSLVGLFLAGTLVVVGAHLSAAAQEDGVGESEPVLARPKTETSRRD